MTPRRQPTPSAGLSRPVRLSPVEAHLQDQGYVPGAKNRRNAKALDAGFRVEAQMVELANAVHGHVCWRRPGVSSLRRNTGDGYMPDAVGVLPELDPLVGRFIPDTPGRRPYNFLLSVKSQNTTGSAKQKILTEITDLAGVCDTTGLVAAVVLQGSHIDRSLIAAAKETGRRDMVAVLTADELGAGDLPAALLHHARRRAAFARKLGPRGGLPAERRKTNSDWAYVHRTATRRAVRRVHQALAQ